ncbi:MAG: alpha/beta hydrolase [Rhodococcus sp. (in: high G+C Gram-positive bacteria)]|uniref:alpha/beta hydrolase n=1 Tax=Rhodococcus sp. TaxID=1831 RepID=UPI003BB5C86F
MRVGLTRLRAWQPASLAVAAAQVTDLSRAVDATVRAASARTGDLLESWSGDTASAAVVRLTTERVTATHLTTAVNASVDALSEAATALGDVRTRAIEIADAAIMTGFAVADDGTVTAPVFTTGTIADLLFQAQLDEQARAIEARLVAVLDTAGDLDESAATALRKALTDLDILVATPSGGRLGGGVTAILDGNAFLPDDPRELNAFWESLTPAEKDALFAYDPTIGNRDGLPVVDRDHYNRAHLPELQERAAAHLAQIEFRHPDWARGENTPRERVALDDAGGPGFFEYERWAAEHDAAKESVSGLETIAEQVDRDGLPRFLLSLDGDGRAAIASNNPDTAQNVVTFVPGTGSRLSEMGRDIDRSERMLSAAEDADNSTRTSVVTWYGYNAPQTIVPEAGQERFADAGAPRLDSFQDGLRASHDGPPSRNVIVAHSYGTTVVGHAARSGGSLDADALVFVGSPGVGVLHADALALDSVTTSDMHDHVYATAAAADPVPAIPSILRPLDLHSAAHGANPAGEDFGAQVFEGNPGESVRLPVLGHVGVDLGSHSEYWNDDNPSLASMGRIIAGLPL